MSKIKHYNVKIEVVGPLFIGSGQKINRSEFIYDERDSRIYVMDTFKMFKGLEKLSLIKKYENYVINSSYEANLFNFIRQNNIKSSEYSKWASYSYAVEPSDKYNKNILTCMKDAYNMPYLPGSSFKGAVRNALLNTLLLKNSDKLAAAADRVEAERFERRDKYLSNEAKNLDVKLFHRKRTDDEDIKLNNAVNSIFRAFRVSDSKPIALENIILCKKVDVSSDGNRNVLGNVLRECIKPGTIIELSVEVDEEIFKYNQNSIENAIKIMYNNTNRCHLSKFPDIHNEKGNLLYIGGGSGFVSKTAVYSLFNEHKRALKNASVILNNVCPKNKMGNHINDYKKYGVSPRVRKCTIYKKRLYDFGLCRVEFQPIG